MVDLSWLLPLLIGIAPVVVSLVVIVISVNGIIFYQRWKHKNRRSPLTFKMLRSPGHSLFKVLDDLNFDLSSNLLLLFFLPTFILSAHTSAPFFLGTKVNVVTTIINVVIAILAETFLVYRVSRIIARRHRIREAYEAECAVGSELNMLMREGAYVFHDLEGDGFNIDHVIVSPAGVFCVETKSRAKFTQAERSNRSHVEFDGKVLRFPTHVETKPVEQVRRNAKWLKDWLAKSSAEQIDVRPVLAFPGWFVTSKARSDVLLVSGKNVSTFLKNATTTTPLTQAQMQRIFFQLDQRCRDVEPFQYPQKKTSPFATKESA